MMAPVIQIKNLKFGYRPNQTVLDIPEFNVKKGEKIFLLGPSGSGKTTFLSLLSGVLKSNAGELAILDRNLSALSSDERDEFRGAHMGVIFQSFNLIPYLSVLDNVLLPIWINSSRAKKVSNPTADATSLL